MPLKPLLNRSALFLRRHGLTIVLFACLAHLGWLLRVVATPDPASEVVNLRNPDFPRTYISRIHLDLASPNHFVNLVWTGPNASRQQSGPFRSSPGAGWGDNDCNDVVESNCPESRCTPKGLHQVQALQHHMRSDPQLRYVTVIDQRRAICFHAHPSIPQFPASQGCIRLDRLTAQLIHDNSIPHVTNVLIDGLWTNPNRPAAPQRK